MDDDQVVGLGKVDDFRKKLRSGAGAGRVVRIVQHEHLGLLQHISRNIVEIRQIIVHRCQREIVHLAVVIFGVRAEHRITGDGHDDSVAGIDESGGQDGECRLAADRVQHFRVGIDPADAADLLEKVRGGNLQRLPAVVGVTAVAWILSLLVELGHDLREGHFVRLADAHVNDFGTGVSLKHGVFGTLDLLKFVDSCVLTVFDTADSFSEQILNIAFGHVFCWKTAVGQAGPSRAKLIHECK